MHTGNGKELWMRESSEEYRRAGLMDRNLLDSDEQIKLEVKFPNGGGKTNPWTYTISTDPYISNPAVRSPKYVDLREARPEIGD